MIKMNRVLVACMGIVVLGACRSFQTPEIREPKQMRVQVVRFEESQPVVRIEGHCYNQNAIGFTFLGGSLDLFMEGLPLGHAKVDTSFAVAAHSAFVVPIQFRMDAKNLADHGVNLAKEVRIRVEGTMSGSAIGVRKTLPISYEGDHLIDLRMNYPVEGK